MTRARTWLVLTVGEGQAGSDIAFCHPSLQATDKEDREDRKMQRSHVRRPHSSAGLPATLCFSDFSRIHEESFIKLYLCCFSLSLPFSAASGGLNGSCTVARSRRSPWACWRWRWSGMEICDLRMGRTASAGRPPCIQTAASQICEEKSNVSQMRDFYRQAWGLVHWFWGISG